MSSHPKLKLRLDGQPQTLSEKIIDEEIISLYVQNIPFDLNKEGLRNIFVRAGDIDVVRIMPSKNTDSVTTYGFVHFKTKTAAMKAIQMFNGYKIGQQFLKVKMAKPIENGGNNRGGSSSWSRNDGGDSSSTTSRGGGGGGGGGNGGSSNGRGGDGSGSFRNRNTQSDFEDVDRSEDESAARRKRFSSAKTLSSSNTRGAGDTARDQRDEEENWAVVNRSNDSLQRKSGGRGQVAQSIREKYSSDVSRPYARRMVSRRNSSASGAASTGKPHEGSFDEDQFADHDATTTTTTTSNRRPSVNTANTNRVNSPQVEQIDEKLAVGEKYHVDVTHASNPSYFYVRKVKLMQNIANLMSNMDNCYRNESDDDRNSEIELIKNLNVGELCACRKENYWYRGQIIYKHQQSFTIRLVDFGDCNEFEFNDLAILKPEFRQPGILAVRCAIAGVKPYESHEWSMDAVEMMKNLLNIHEEQKDNKLYAVVLGYDQDNENNQICLIELYLTVEDESITNYLLENKLAEKLKEDEIINYNHHMDEYYNGNDIYSVSAQDLRRVHVGGGCGESTFNESNVSPVAYLVEQQERIESEGFAYLQRSRLFSCNFRIWKWRDLKRMQTYKCGQKSKIRISCVYNTRKFYVQRLADDEAIDTLNTCLQNYANVFLNDDNVHAEIYNFMLFTSKNDIVLAKCCRTHEWKRAIVMDKGVIEDDNDNPISYFQVFFIDYGNEEMICYTKLLSRFDDTKLSKLIVVLPINEKIINTEAHALKCALKRPDIKHKTVLNFDDLNHIDSYENQFEIKFRLFNENKHNFVMNINQIDAFKVEPEAVVDLFIINNDERIDCVQFIRNQIVTNDAAEDDSSSTKSSTTTKLDSTNKKIIEQTEKQLKDGRVVTRQQHKQQQQSTITAEPQVQPQPPKQTAVSNQQRDRQSFVQLLELGVKYDVTLIYPKSLRKFFVTLNKQTKVIEQIQAHINSASFINLTSPLKTLEKIRNGDLILAFYQPDESWYRAIVIDNKLVIDTIRVFFVDYGNDECISLKSLRYLPPSIDDNIFYQQYQITNCELNLSDAVYRQLQKDKELNDEACKKFKELEGVSLYMKISYIFISNNGTSGSSQQDDIIDSYLPRCLVNLYFDENESETEKTFFNTLNLPIDEKPKSAVAAEVSKVHEELFVKLNKNEVYRMNAQYADDTDNYLYFILSDQTVKLNKIQEKLQEPETLTRVRYVNRADQLLVGQHLEGLYKTDDQWYRVVVKDKNDEYLTLYFVDFGNTEVLNTKDIGTKKLCDCLRIRIANDELINKTEYSAVKCFYKEAKLNSISELSNLVDINNNEGILFKIKDVLYDSKQIPPYNYSIEPVVVNNLDATIENEEDDEVKLILETKLEAITKYSKLSDLSPQILNLDLKKSEQYSITISHANNTSDFYVQLNDNIKNLLRQQQVIQDLMAKLMQHQQHEHQPQIQYSIGDYIFAKYLVDSNWYRAIVTGIYTDDDNQIEYDVYFVDYGNKEKLNEDNIRPITCLYNLIDVKQAQYQCSKEEIKPIIELPFQAISCDLTSKVKQCTRNTEILKTLINDCMDFGMKIMEITQGSIINADKTVDDAFLSSVTRLINKYSIELYSDGDLLNKKFENVSTKPATITQIKTKSLELNQIYECKYVFADVLEEIYVHLIEDSQKVNELEACLNSESIIAKMKQAQNISKNEYVLAKFQDSWFRARVLNVESSNTYEIVFIDYGNVEKAVPLSDLRQYYIGSDQIELLTQPAFALCVRLFDALIDVDKHSGIIQEMIVTENFKIKIIEHSSDDKYSVESYDSEMNVCYNKLINKSYGKAKEEEVSHINEINKQVNEFMANKQPLDTEYVYMKDVDQPIYLILSQDNDKLTELNDSLDKFYSENEDKSGLFQINDYCVALFDGHWTRAQIIDLNDRNKTATIYFIDYGNTESDIPLSTLRHLVKSFNKYYRMVFKVKLIDVNSKDGQFIDFTPVDKNEELTATLAQLYESYYYKTLAQEAVEKNKLRVELIEYSESDDVYHAIVYSFDGKNCLNTDICNEFKKKEQKQVDFIKLTLKQLKEQQAPSQTVNYNIFAQRIDLFYAYDEEICAEIQINVQNICASIIDENCTYKPNELIKSKMQAKLPIKGNLVFGKYEEDQLWYRCMITNISDDYNKYELYFIDFGNTEIVSSDEILLPYKQDHVNIFTGYQAQAYKCKLYGLKTPFNDTQNSKFKTYISEKKYNVKVFTKTNEGASNVAVSYEVKLTESNTTNNVHFYLSENNIVSFMEPFESLIKSIKTHDQVDFYIEHLNIIKSKLK